jgi:hypothetical protein
MNAKSLLLGVAAMVNFRLLFVVDGSNGPRISSHGERFLATQIIGTKDTYEVST